MSLAFAEDCDWTGTWDIVYGGPLVLQQSDDIVTGTYPYEQGGLSGTVSGNKLIATWTQIRGGEQIAGDCEFEMFDDCTFTGIWRYTTPGYSQEWRTDWPGLARRKDTDSLGQSQVTVGQHDQISEQPAATTSEIPDEILLEGSETFDDAELAFLAGDIDNLGFGWPQGFDVFSGSSTPTHSYPWEPDANDPAGTDRIMVGTSYDGHPPAGRDGYVSTTSRPDNQPQAITMQYDLGETQVESAILQMFVDDFQSPIWKSKFQVEINGRRAPFMEEVLNSLVQTGPIGKLITVQIPDEFLGDVSGGMLSIHIDDPTTGAGDGYAVDFVRLLINPKTMTNTGRVFGEVSDKETGDPIKGAIASASGVIKSSTDFDGKYTLTEVPAGLVAVTVSKSDYVSQTKTTDLTSGGDAELDFLLENAEHTDEVAQEDESEIINNWNIGSVDNNPGCSPSFTIDRPHRLTYIDTYHWNYGKGASGGTIGLRKDDGTLYGPWEVETMPGQGGVPNAYWIARPNEVLPAGTYTVEDSDQSTWSQNSESEGCGFSKVKGNSQVAVDEGPDSRVQTIGPEGGSIDLGDGIRIIFPAGAVDEDIEVTARKLDPSAYLKDEMYEGIVLDVNIPAKKLNKPAEIRVPLPAYINSESGAAICGTISEETGILAVNSSKVDLSEGNPELVLSTDHFSKTWFQWLKERFLLEPFSSDPLVVPYYEQARTPFCWAASTLMLCQAANFKEDAQVFSFIGYMGIDGPDMSMLRGRLGSGLSSYIEGHTGIEPIIAYWDVIGASLSGGSTVRSYIHRELAYNHNPVMVYDWRKGHSYLIVGYEGDKEFYVHDSMDPQATASICSLRTMDFASSPVLTAVVPKDISDSDRYTAVGLNNRGVILRQVAKDPDNPVEEKGPGSAFLFIWDYKSPDGWSIINTKSDKVESLPGDMELIELTKPTKGSGDSGISIANSDRNSARDVSISLEILEEGEESSKAVFSTSKSVSVPPLSVVYLSIDPIKFAEFYKGGAGKYRLRVTAYDQNIKIAETGFNFALKPADLEIIRPFSEVEKGVIGADYTFQVRGQGVPDEAKYEWNFDDDGIETGNIVTHIFKSSRDYNVKVKANWKGGSAEAKTVISIAPDQQIGKGEVTFIVFRWTRRLGIDPDTGQQYKKERQYCQDFTVDGKQVIASNGMYSINMPSGRHKYTVDYRYVSPLADSGTTSGDVDVVADKMTAVEVETPPAEYNP